MSNHELEGGNRVNNAVGGNHLGNPQYELSQLIRKYRRGGSQEIISQEIPRLRKSIPKGATYNYYGDDSRKVAIKALGGHGAFIRVLSKGVPRDGSCIDGRCVYTMKNNPSEAGRAATEAYFDDQRMLDARFARNVITKMRGVNSSAPSAQLRSLRVLLSPMAYIKWDFWVMGVSRAFIIDPLR